MRGKGEKTGDKTRNIKDNFSFMAIGWTRKLKKPPQHN
jgi:hypothetical protein